ncbi:MAG: glycosyltransferase family 4 protein [Armatimonadota bacterium]|nr:glycosyltransferase family 4 protein [Armatimonadota bacterium]
MKVLLTYVMVGRGGDAVQLAALVDALRDQGHDVAVVGANAVMPYAFDTAGARLRGLVRRSAWWIRDLLEIGLSLVVAWRAWRAARACGCDLQIHRAGVYDAAPGYVARRLGVPLALYLDAHVEAERAFRHEPYWRRLHRAAVRGLGQTASVIVAPSRPVAAYYAGLGLPAGRIVVRRNGVHSRHLAAGQEAARTYPPMADDRRCTVGFVGSLTRWHRVDLLLLALRELVVGSAPEMSDDTRGRVAYRAVVIGRGAEFDALRAQSRALGLDAHVEWRGALPHDDAVAAMREFDIAVLPGTLETGAPMKLAEYAAMSRPIVAPDLPNIRDLFVPEQEICLFAPGNPRALAAAIRRLTGAPDPAQRMGRAARARVAESTWEHTARFLLEHAAARVPTPEGNAPFARVRDGVGTTPGR